MCMLLAVGQSNFLYIRSSASDVNSV